MPFLKNFFTDTLFCFRSLDEHASRDVTNSTWPFTLNNLIGRARTRLSNQRNLSEGREGSSSRNQTGILRRWIYVKSVEEEWVEFTDVSTFSPHRGIARMGQYFHKTRGQESTFPPERFSACMDTREHPLRRTWLACDRITKGGHTRVARPPCVCERDPCCPCVGVVPRGT